MKKCQVVRIFAACGILLGWTSASGSGFGLYEMSAKAHALGGAVVGRAADASAVFYNPATLADFTNVTVTAGFVTQHPRARMTVDGGRGSSPMDPGCFMLPFFNLAVPLPLDFAFGLGLAPEYGLGTSYATDWELVNSSHETTVESLTLTPNLCWTAGDFSIGVGLRFMWFDFEQFSEPMPGLVEHRLKGDNRCRSVGWQGGLRYRLLDNLAVGLVYKSQMKVDVDGKSELSGAAESLQTASTDLMMPDSLSAGFNWDITPTWHLGAAFMWTQWSTIDTLAFRLGGAVTPCELCWSDTYRVAVAPSWDFAEGWTWMASYAYETDCTADQRSTMLPAANRHMLATGLSWRCLECLEVSLSYGLILMDGFESQAADAAGRVRGYAPHRGLSHAAGLSVTFSF